STQRGYGRNHPFAGEIRSGNTDIFIVPEELGCAVTVGRSLTPACERVTGIHHQPDERPLFATRICSGLRCSVRKAKGVVPVDMGAVGDGRSEGGGGGGGG
ncbi:carbon-phosphorus lyase complex subunit PhnI, partial [Escherichia coli]|uniref:carbon-phosphorus lyase complex subunit PhnI n=1 Tax=Escherichia coli TaxID=562 RepID=UPI00207B4A30